MAQEYTYQPNMQEYTNCGSSSSYVYHGTASYSGCQLPAGNYYKGHVNVMLQSHNVSSGDFVFRVSKCDSNPTFANGSSGTIYVVDSYFNRVYCTSYSVPTSGSTYFRWAYLDNYGNFTGTRDFEVFLIPNNAGGDQYYAGKITVTRVNQPPTTPSNPSPANGATGVSTSPSLSWNCTDPEGGSIGFDIYYGTSSSNLSSHVSGTGTSAFLSGLGFNQTYYWKVIAYDSQNNSTEGPVWHFTTRVGDTPVAMTQEATVDGTTVTLNGKVNPQNLETTYCFQYGTTTNYGNNTISGILPASISTSNVSTFVTGLQTNTTYHFRIYASNSAGSMYGADYTFTTGDNDCFVDCSEGDCGGDANLSQQIYNAAQYLCNRGVVTGDEGAYTLRPSDDITRGELAKAAFFGLYSDNNGVNIPPMVTDYFPCIYPDLQETSFYYQAAKALLYLEYYDASAQHLDGISPFDRDRSCFDPDGTISRCLVLKVMLETFNIKPAIGGTNPFSDFPSNANFWGYAKKAHELGIVVLDNGNTAFNPYQDCTRGEAILFLSRILHLIDNNIITKPVPNYDTYNPFTSDFFIPTNLSPEIVNSMRGAEYGNFNYYNKDFFNISGYMNLDFGIEYNSYLTEMPDDFYPVKPLGKAWTHTYDMYMNVVQDNYNNISYLVFHLHGGSLLMYKETNGVQEKLTEGNYYTLTKSGNSYMLKSTGQLSYTFTLKTDNVYHLTQIKNRNNDIIIINYDTSGDNVRVSSVTTQGRTLTFSYNSDNLLSSVKDPRNRIVYFYYTDGQLTSLKDAKSQTTSFSYGTLDFEKGLLKEITLPKGNHVYNGYQQRKLQSMSYSDGYNQVTHTSINITPNYQNGSTVSSVTETLSNSQSVTTTYTMNDKQRVTNVNDGVSTNVSFEYGLDGNESGLVTGKTDHKTGLQTSYAYDTRNGMVSSFTVSNGSESHSMTVVYDEYNDITQFTDANNNTTHYYYESSNHNLTRVVDAMGHATYIENNSHGVPIRVTNPMGLAIEYDYNTYGNLNEISIPSLDLTATIEYDNVSRIIDKYDFAGHNTHYTYDDNDNLATVVNADGKTTSYHVDANDNVDWIQNALGYKTNFTYDANTDFLTQVEFQGHTRSYTYKRDGTLESFTDANGNTFNYTYNNAGELTSDGYANLSYYSTTGQIWKVTKDGNDITYTYDDFGRISSIAYDGKTVSYTYDNNGNILTMTYPDNKTVTYTYDSLNRITSVKDWNNKTTSYNYRNDGQLAYYQYPNGVRTTYNYDASGRCNGISTKRDSGNGSVIAEYSFEFDNMGNHIRETFTEPYEAYPSIPSANLTYNYNNDNRLTSVGDLSFTYDGNGNNKTRTGRTYNYDDKNNLISVSGDFTASYTYDGLGNRRSATRNGETTKYVLNLLGNIPMVLMDTDGSGTAQHYYIYGPAGLFSRIDANNNTRYYVYDYRGSTIAMTDATTSANITHKYQYDDFGKLLQVEEEDNNPFRYVGKFGVAYEDEALTFMRTRYYDPEIGRFLSEDPIWSTNLYPYADNNPIMWIDPIGEYVVGKVATFADLAYTKVTTGNFIPYETREDKIMLTINVASQFLPPVVGDAFSVGLFIGHVIGDAFDEEITNGMAAVITGTRNATKWIKNTYNNVKSDVNAAVNAVKENRAARQPQQVVTPKFQVDEEAMHWIFSSSDFQAKRLHGIFMEVAGSDRSSAEKQKLYTDLFRIAHEYMPK